MNASLCRLLQYPVVVAALCGLFAMSPASVSANETTGPRLSPSQSLEALAAGNARFVAGKPLHPRQDAERRAETAHGQQPGALVLACADSRVAVETLFDQGLGDVFVVRFAGNSAPPAILASLEYAVEHLNVPLVVVLGHTECGAVKLACSGAPLTGLQQHMVGTLQPVAAAVKAAGPVEPAALHTQVAREHARSTAQAALDTLPGLRDAVRAGKTQVLPAMYAVDSGVVEWLDPVLVPGL